MKTIHSFEAATLPKDVTVKVKGRLVTVTGPRGTLKRNFNHQKVRFLWF